MREIKALFWKFVLVAIFITLLTSVSPISAVEYTVGVQAGDWVKYGHVSITWTGTGTEPSYVTEGKKVDWLKMEVQSINGTTVNMISTVHYSNNTETPQTSSYDVKSGQTSGETTFLGFVVAANLKKGDPISQESNSPTVNDTVSRVYAGASRSVNVIDLAFTYMEYTTELTAYWDQAKGVMLELYMKMPDYATDGAFVEESIKATETNMWSADVLGLVSSNVIYIFGIMALVIGIVLIVVVVFFMLRRKPIPIAAPAPTPTVETIK